MEQTLGKRIIAHRKRLGLTQDALAERLGVTAQAVSKWENDQSCPDIGMLPRLAAIFGTTTDELLGIEKQEEAKQGEVVENLTEENSEGNGSHSAKGEFDFRWSSGRRDALTFAVLVLLVGSLTLASRLFSWNAGFWSILWPSTLLVYGIRHMLSRFTLLRLSAVLMGAYFLCANLNLWEFNLGSDLILPAILLIFGVSLLVDALRKPRRPSISLHAKPNPQSKHHKRIDGEHFDCAASFCEDVQHIAMPRLSSGRAAVSFGEMTLDLSGVEEVAGECNLKLSCSFGQMILKVPQKYRVCPRSSNFFSGTTISGEPDENPAGVIYADASASFGEICIHYV